MKSIPKRILFLTATRADFGKLKPLIQAVENSEELESYIFATGMHMLSLYGSTVHEIYKAGFKRVFSYINQDASVNSQMDLVLGNTIHGLGHYIREFPADMIVIHGDRVEALAGAIVGALNNILVVHIEGGEVSGTVDELIRHAVSKLSHLHFVSNEEARKRLVQMGERDDSIHVIGSPDIDVMLSDTLPSLEEVKRKYDVSFNDYSLFIYHPVTTELQCTRANIENIVGALEASGRNFVIIYPNNDVGRDVILEALENLRPIQRFRLVPSLRFEYFLTLLKNSRAIVGNSSAGIREAPVYGIPTINIGTRQKNRFEFPSILNVSENKEELLYCLRNLPVTVPHSNHFGNGNSKELFMRQLHKPELWKTSRQKQFMDLKLL